jgi:serine/threonine-protein phosphatase 2A regulatory subunit A
MPLFALADLEEIRKMIPAIRSEDKALRLQSLENLPKIAQLLRPQRTRDELIPFTIETPDHDDAALCTIARVLGQMLNEVGGPKHINSLLDALWYICESEDNSIRETAVSSLVSLGKSLPTPECAQTFLPFVSRMLQDAWHPLRCAGCTIICRLYQQLAEKDERTVDALLHQLSSDALVGVKRTLAQSVHVLVELPKPPRIVFTILTALAADDSVSIAVEIPSVLALLGGSHTDFAVKIADTLLKSTIWQAHAVLIGNIDEIFARNPPKEFIKKVSQSAHSSVICAAVARQLKFFLQAECYASADEFRQFAMSLVTHPDSLVRTAAAASLGKMPELPFAEEALVLLAGDPEQDVKMAALTAIARSGIAHDAAIRQIGVLVASHQWRVKKGIAALVPTIAAKTDAEAFGRELFPIVTALFADDAADVRAAITDMFPGLVAQFGEDWRNNVIVPIIRNQLESSDYHLRKTAVHALITLKLEEAFADLIQRAAEDPVANVRLVLARDLPRGAEVLTALKADPDCDVASYASKT